MCLRLSERLLPQETKLAYSTQHKQPDETTCSLAWNGIDIDGAVIL